jgi:hypothetical protein
VVWTLWRNQLSLPQKESKSGHPARRESQDYHGSTERGEVGTIFIVLTQILWAGKWMEEPVVNAHGHD